MEKKLIKNICKGNWKHNLDYLLIRLDEERKELDKAIEERNFGRVIEECADIANLTMMIAENVNEDLYNWEDLSKGEPR